MHEPYFYHKQLQSYFLSDFPIPVIDFSGDYLRIGMRELNEIKTFIEDNFSKCIFICHCFLLCFFLHQNQNNCG